MFNEYMDPTPEEVGLDFYDWASIICRCLLLLPVGTGLVFVPRLLPGLAIPMGIFGVMGFLSLLGYAAFQPQSQRFKIFFYGVFLLGGLAGGSWDKVTLFLTGAGAMQSTLVVAACVVLGLGATFITKGLLRGAR